MAVETRKEKSWQRRISSDPISPVLMNVALWAPGRLIVSWPPSTGLTRKNSYQAFTEKVQSKLREDIQILKDPLFLISEIVKQEEEQ